MVCPIGMKFGMVTHIASELDWTLKFWTFKNPRLWMAVMSRNWKTAISLQQFDRLAQNLARWRTLTLRPYWQLKFPTVKNPTWRKTTILKNRKMAISLQWFDRLTDITFGTITQRPVPVVKILNLSPTKVISAILERCLSSLHLVANWPVFTIYTYKRQTM